MTDERQSGRRRQVKRSVIGLAALLTVTTAAVVSADGGDANQIHACVANGGSVRIVGPRESCKQNEQPVHWGIQGPAGPAGDPGGPGIQGPAGPKGDPGDPAIAAAVPYSGSWLMYLGGGFAGRLAEGAVEGCGFDGEVAESKTTTGVDRHIGRSGFTHCELSIGADMSSAFWQWVNATFSHDFQQKDLVLRRIPAGWEEGTSSAPTIELGITNAKVDGFSIPKLDRTDTGGVWLEVSLAAGSINRAQATCCEADAMAPATMFDASTHVFSLDGGALDPTTTDGIRFTMEPPDNGGPASLRVPSDLDIRVSAGSEGWSVLDTRMAAVAVGGIPPEGLGSLELPVLDESARKLTLNLGGVGVFGGDYAERADGSVRFGLYAETATLLAPESS